MLSINPLNRCSKRPQADKKKTFHAEESQKTAESWVENRSRTWLSNELVSAAVELYDIFVEEGEQLLQVGVIVECTA